MKIKTLDSQISVSDQLVTADIQALADHQVQCIVCNRPDGEASEQDSFNTIAAAATALGIEAVHIPFAGGKMDESHINDFARLLIKHKKIHAYCRTGNRSTTVWAAAKVTLGEAVNSVVSTAKEAGYDVSASLPAPNISRAASSATKAAEPLAKPLYDVIIVGAGSGGIAVAASLHKRQPQCRIAIIDPAEDHYYQPGWTMVGGGVFEKEMTHRNMHEVMPKCVTWIQAAVTEFQPEQQSLQLDNGKILYYQHVVVSPGLSLNWEAIDGLSETLGKNGVTSNYRYDLAPYTWQLVQNLKGGKALFTQPAMPIKCAGAPQKALYLSGDHWHKAGLINADNQKVSIEFYNAGAVLFGVAAYVPALQSYIDKYRANIHFSHNLIKIDGEAKQAWFSCKDAEGNDSVVQTDFDMIHVCPPQVAPDFIRNSPLADSAGWLEVNPETLQHARFNSVWGLGDVVNTTNAKTMAAARKQAPVVAQNISDSLNNQPLSAGYDGYGSCPLTVEHGKIVLAEFGYGGKLLPSFPQWVINGTKATRCAWILKSQILPQIYWHGMLKGREWMAKPFKRQP